MMKSIQKYYQLNHLCLSILFVFFFAAKSLAQDSTNIKVMTYNVLYGFKGNDNTSREIAAIEFIKNQQADVIAFQELNGFTEKSLLELAKQWNHEYAVILKEDGFPVGITSKRPIKLISKMKGGFWHGMLHVSTYGIDFLIVHLSPSDLEVRRQEANLIKSYMKTAISEEKSNYVVLGDFNALSPFDNYLYKNNKYWKKYEEDFDYSVISSFLAYPLKDVIESFEEDVEQRYTFPSPAVAPYSTAEEIVYKRQRIDYILVSPELAKTCTNASVINEGIVDEISDHYPVIAEFKVVE